MERTPLTYLGTPISRNVNFLEPEANYILDNYTFESRKVTLNDVLVSINQPKNIVKTNLVRPQGFNNDVPQQQEGLQRDFGYAGTVKEYISRGDYTIRLQGWLVGEEIDVFPVDKLRQLMEYLEYPGAFGISGEFINEFDFDQVVVNDYNITEQRGFSNQLPFTINLLSDDFITVKYETAKVRGTFV
jgi:hypothetical protein